MKRIMTAILAAALVAGAQSRDEGERMLKAAQNVEVVDGDLKAAIEQYNTIATKYSKTGRAVAAQALIRMAGCQEKLGAAEAHKTYERVIREFADQKELVAVARARLGANESAASGSGDRAVWTGREVDLFGKVSPDGRFITFVDWYLTGNLMLRDLVNGTSHALTNNRQWREQTSHASASYSAFSRDGKHLAFSWHTDRTVLKVAALSGTSLKEPRILPLSDEYSGVRPYDWSPDGRWIAVHLRRADQSGVVGVVAVEDGSVRALQSTDWRQPVNMAFSSDGQFVAFDLPANNDVAQYDVLVLAIDGSRGGKAVQHPSDDRFVGFSPDGRQFLFSSDRTGANALWAQPFADGKLLANPVKVRPDFGSPWVHNITRTGSLYVTKAVSDADIRVAPVDLVAGKLAAAPGNIQAFPTRGWPEWSADGTQLAYIDCGTFGGGPCKLFIRNMETGQTRELEHGLHYVSHHRWSPDGSSLITRGNNTKGKGGIFRIDTATGETDPVLFGGAPRRPEWSEDGRRIIYTQGKEVRELDLASGDDREIGRIPAGNPIRRSISPGGRFVAYVEQNKADKTSKLMVMPVEGGSPRDLLRVSRPESLDISRTSWTLGDGALLVPKRTTAFQLHRKSTWELWLVPVTGDAPRKLDIDVSDWDSRVRLSPDGSQIAAMVGKRSLEVWALENFLPAQISSR